MRKGLFIFLGILGILLLKPNSSFCQSQDSTAISNDQIIELGTTEIKIKIETPQVKLFSSRIKPEFDDVHLEKSFSKEIIGSGETIVFKSDSKVKPTTRIEIDKILKKLR